MSSEGPVLSVQDLSVEFRGHDRTVYAVRHVSFNLRAGEVLGLVGESGSGKSATSLAIMGLLPPNVGRIASGEVRLRDPKGGREVDLLKLPSHELEALRGARIAMIFQDPMTSLNPYLTVEEQLCEVPMWHLGLSRKEARERALALLERVGIPDPVRRIRGYPHEFSGGMRQRVMIVMGLLCDPQVLIADEPTTALDVTIQAQILELLAELSQERKLAVILITHDLGVVARTCDRVLVMYAGRIVERAPVAGLFGSPSHPYTQALLGSVPSLEGARGGELSTISGLPPRLEVKDPGGCTFGPRCHYHRPLCDQGEPDLRETGPARARRCVVPVEELLP